MPAGRGEPGFSRSVTPGLVRYLNGKFGRDAAIRIAGWQVFIGALLEDRRPREAVERERLEAINLFFNRVPFVTDREHWGVEDYWASPAEMLSSRGGDCEDFSVAKYFALKELGVPIGKLRITYVKAVRINQAHMVLAYYPQPDAEPLILDNLDQHVRPASERPDLVPVYSFNDEDLLVAGSDARLARRGSPLQIRMWSALLDKLEQEQRY